MKRSILVWDLPTRLFHWLLAACVLGAFAIGKTVDDDAPLFRLHMLLGATAGFMVILRVVWGFVGTRWARFSSFVFGPKAVFDYFRSLLAPAAERHVGHNPGSSVAIFAMLLLTLGAVVTGAQMGTGGELVEELHEVMANGLIVVSTLHVIGVVTHVVLRKENIVRSMIDGTKQGEDTDAIAGSRPAVGLGFVLASAAWAMGLVGGYDAQRGTVRVPLVGVEVQVGEAGEGAEREAPGAGEGEEAHDEDDD
jgi:cytochrome b